MEEARGLKSKQLFPAIFSRHATAYQRRLDGIMARGEARGRQRVIELLDVKAGMRVLDLACGPGTLTRPLAGQVAPDGEVVGVDLAPGMIDLARAAGIAEPTPKRRASYEAVVTTARGPVPATITGNPRSSGRRRTSTDT